MCFSVEIEIVSHRPAPDCAHRVSRLPCIELDNTLNLSCRIGLVYPDSAFRVFFSAVAIYTKVG